MPFRDRPVGGFLPAQQASGRLGGTRSTLTISLSGARATNAYQRTAAVESLKKAKSGKSYEEQSKKLPDVISTG